jgi:hypothetical protein
VSNTIPAVLMTLINEPLIFSSLQRHIDTKSYPHHPCTFQQSTANGP